MKGTEKLMKFIKKTTKILAVICIFSVIISALSGCGKKVTTAVGEAFGNKVSFIFYSEETDAVSGHFNDMMASIKEAENDFSLSEGSYLSELNEKGISYVSATLKKDLEDSVIVCTTLGDITDISSGSLTRLWGFYTDSPAVPDEALLKSAAEKHTLDNLVIARDSHKVTVSEGTEIDMAPVAEGLALDRAFETGKLCKIPYIVTLGDITAACGNGTDDGKWEISLRDPFAEEESFATVKVEGRGSRDTVFVSASGVWKNSFTENGKTYHSYLDPDTGLPADNGLVSVTVVTASGITSDALSDALLVNGFRESSFIYLNAYGAEAVFVFEDKTYYVTEGLKDSFKLSDTSYSEHTEAPATELF